MTDAGGLAIAILAAGQSRRFGNEDKLTADLDGRMLGLHPSETLSGLPAAHRWVVASSAEHPCADGWRAAGFEIAVNKNAENGLGTSVALAAKLASEAGAIALLIALADMPFVSRAHFADLASKAAPDILLASHNRMAPTPPALFGSDHFAALKQATGDRGAGTLLKHAEIIRCPADDMRDVDVPEDLAGEG